MLEVLVERRAAEVQNQPGPHVQKAFDALVRASKGEWGPGEPRLMADYLAGLGKITQTKLADEQVRQLKSLLDKAAAGTLDRLHIADQYAATLYLFFFKQKTAYEIPTSARIVIRRSDNLPAVTAEITPTSTPKRSQMM